MEDPLLPKNYRGEQRSGCRRILIIVGFLFLSLAFLYMLVISILSPILWVNYNNSIAQNSLDASIISFDSMTLKNPTQNTLTVDSNITISQAGKFAATLKSSTVNVLYQGEVFGRMELPERELKGDNEPTSFTQSSLLTITNPTVFQQTSAKLLKGSNVRWRLSGDVTLSVKMGFSLDFSLRLEKDVELFGAKLEDVRAYNLKVVQGLEDRLIVSQTQYVNNPSNIAMENMGDLTFDIYVPQLDASHTRSLKRFRAPTSTLDGFVKISEVYINNFNSPRGPNTIKNTTAAAIRTANNVASLENFLSTWNMGKDQSVRLVGPIASSTNSSFLLNILDIEATIEGNPTNKIIQYARFGDDDSGNPVQTAYNPLDLPVTQSDFDFEVYLTAPFFPYFDGMGAAFAIASFNNLACVAKPTFGNLSLAGVDATIPAKSYENISVTVSSNSKQYCDSFRIWAVCCGLYSGTFDSQDGATNPYLNITNRSFQIGTRGTMTTKIEKFKFTQTFQQDGFNMTCGTDTNYFNDLCYTGQGPSTYCLQSNNQYCNSLLPPPPTPAPPTPAPPTPAPPAPAPK